MMTDSDEPRDIGTEILDGIRNIKAGKVGRVLTVPSVAGIRGKTGLSQTEFARLIVVSVRTLQEWEQGRRTPSGPARTLLMIADKNPSVLLDLASELGNERLLCRAVHTPSDTVCQFMSE